MGAVSRGIPVNHGIDSIMILVSFATIYLIGVLSHLFAWKVTVKLPGTGNWTLGFSGVGIGQVLYGVYLLTHTFAFAAIGYIFDISGVVLIVRGCYIFILGKRRITTELAIAVAGITASMVFSGFYLDPVIRLAFGNLAFATLQFRATVIFLKCPDHSLKPTVFFVSLCLGCLGVVELVQVAMVLVTGDVNLYFITKFTYLILFQVTYLGLIMTSLHLSYARFQQRLKTQSIDKDILLQEMHHRTKNNLALVNSLVSLESSGFSDGMINASFTRISSRIRTIALLHDRLQHAGATRLVRSDEYFAQILGITPVQASSDGKRIETIADIEALEIDTKTAITLGLIVNELFTNAMKHAFPDNRSGKISVSFKRHGDHFVLVVEDNGIGMPAGSREGSLGLSLIRALADQLLGSLMYESSSGTRFTLSLPVQTIFTIPKQDSPSRDGECS